MVTANCHPEIASISRRLYQSLRDLLFGAFILLDFGKGHPHPSGKPDTFPYLGEGLLSLHASKFAKGSEKEIPRLVLSSPVSIPTARDDRLAVIVRSG